VNGGVSFKITCRGILRPAMRLLGHLDYSDIANTNKSADIRRVNDILGYRRCARGQPKTLLLALVGQSIFSHILDNRFDPEMGRAVYGAPRHHAPPSCLSLQPVLNQSAHDGVWWLMAVIAMPFLLQGITATFTARAWSSALTSHLTGEQESTSLLLTA
jgi:hypothetical protein